LSPWWVRLAEELWPRATWNDQIRKLWTERFRNEEGEMLAQCIRNVRCSRSSERVEIAWVIAEVQQFKSNRQKHRNQQEPKEDPKERADREAAEAEADAAGWVASLRMLPEEELSRLKAHVARCLPGLRMRGDPTEWSRLAIGLVHACGVERNSWSTPSPEPSPVLEPSSVTGASASTGLPRHRSSSSPAGTPLGEPSDETVPASAGHAEFW
jgi:hypothetical protein